MNFELMDQSVQYTFNNEAYGEDGFKKRTLKNVKKTASAEGGVAVGKAMAGLQDDALGAVVLIQRQGVPLTD